ncbi:MAG TPA: PAS domain-containing sensor histidine kinase, partial [Methanoregulaceae archaeon]|nr:PAS domain-containing sensor histidine kinase [Methanoregulaceae archaeon]
FETGEQFRSSGQITFGGEPYWFDHSLVPVRDAAGNITRVLGISRDITEQKRVEEALRLKTEELETHYQILNTLLDTVPIGIFMAEAPSGKPVIANREAIRLLGRGILPDATGENLAEVYEAYLAGTDKRYPRDEMPLVRGLKGETSHVDNMVVRKPHGDQVQLEIFGNPVFDRQNQVVASLVSFLDITDRKRAEEIIHDLAQFPEENPHPVLRLAADGTLLYANNPGKEWLSALYEPAGQKLPDIILALVADALNKGGVHFAEVEEDSRKIHEVTAIVPDGEEYVNLYVSDITERKRVERAIRETNEKISLLTGITRHDLANQVSILKGFAQIALLNDPDPVVADSLEKIDAVGSTISRQIEFTRAYQELGMHAPGWYRVRDLVSLRKPQDIAISCACDAEIYGDPMLEKVFSNIIDNASRHGEHVTELVVRCMEDPGGILIIIEDDGVGVPYETKERIFEKGYGKNTGFGLFLAREILAITGITIHETGIPGKGARFDLHIPRGNFKLRSESDDISQ